MAVEEQSDERTALIAEGAAAYGYLGWFWRDYWDGELSWVPADEGMDGGDWRLDPARKWSYPRAQLSPEDTERARELLIALAHAKRELTTLFETYRSQLY